MTNEKFLTQRHLGGAVPAELLTPGILHELPVPGGMRDRFIWLAAGAFFQYDITDCWYVLGKLTFRRRGTPVGRFDFSDASNYLTAAERAAAPREITRLKPNGTGSQQPSLQFREYATVTPEGRDNLDMACFSFRLDCDQIDYEIEKTYANVPVRALNMLFGLKVLSL